MWNAIWSRGDFYSNHKAMIHNNPDLVASATNIRSNVILEIVDLDLFKDFLHKQDCYIKSKQLSGFLSELIPSSLMLSSNKETWPKRRESLEKIFSAKTLRESIPNMKIIAKEALNKLSHEKQLDNVNVIDHIIQITGYMIGKSFFGEKFAGYEINGKSMSIELEEILHQIFGVGLSPLGLAFGPLLKLGILPQHRKLLFRIRNFRQKLLEMIKTEKIEYLTNKTQFPEIKWIHYFFNIQEDTQQVFKDLDLLDEFLMIFMESVNTTAHAIVMMLYFLALYPDLKKRMEQEFASNYEDKELTLDALHSLSFTDAFIKEALRYVPPRPGTLFRVATTDHTLAGFKVKKGTLVTTPFIPIHFNSKYHEAPEKFSVERWLSPDTRSMKADPLSWIPFSAGTRQCLGKQNGLAQAEIKIVIAEFLRKFDFNLIEGYTAKMGLNFFYEPVNPVKMVLTPKTMVKEDWGVEDLEKSPEKTE